MGRETKKKKPAGTMAAMVFYTSFKLLSCAPAAIPSYQIPVVPQNLSSIVVEKKTSEADFIEKLKKRKVSNIISVKSVIKGRMVSAVTGDYMKDIYLFKDGEYLGKLKIDHDKYHEPVFPVAKIVRYNGGFGVLLVAKNLKYEDKRVVQLILLNKEGKQKNMSISIEKQIKKHGEIWDPFVGGESLETGVFFTGRTETWETWPSAYKITYDGEVHMTKTAVGNLRHCSCFDSWKSGEDVFHIRVE